MRSSGNLLSYAALAGLVAAAPQQQEQQLDFGLIAAAHTVANGPRVIDGNPNGVQSASLATSVTITAAVTATTTAANAKRGIPDTTYTPYYPALATGYTTDPALSATRTTTAGQACVTQPEAGTYCGFINPEDPCAPQPDGYGPVPTPDTASAFLAYPPFHAEADAAPPVIPSVNNTAYTQVFHDLNAAVAGQSYLGLYTFKTYDPAYCAAECDATELCTAFNIFIERDPSLNPTDNDSNAPTVWGDYCPNPPSMTSFKCTLWGSNIDASMATNTGQTREQFQIVITGSDGYDKTNVTTPPPCSNPPYPYPSPTPTGPPGPPGPPTPTNPWWNPWGFPTPTWTPWGPGQPSGPWGQWPWGEPYNCHKKAIHSPKHSLGSRFFPGPFNPQVCASYAYFQNIENARVGDPLCQMFNAYYLNQDGVAFGTYCTLYDVPLGGEYCTFGFEFNAEAGVGFECTQSWTYALAEFGFEP